MKPKPLSKPFKSRRTHRQQQEDSAPAPTLISAPTPEAFPRASLRLPQAKRPVSLRLDPDLLAWFKAEGPGYQTRINAVLRLYAEGHGLKA